MINRIVRMHFRRDEEQNFVNLFNQYKESIAAFEGCTSLHLLKETGDDCVYFTYSVWQSESHLEQYRKSALFKTVWSATRALFEGKPMAWSTTVADHVK
jgi:heme-degrading monooxygenase HmoA